MVFNFKNSKKVFLKKQDKSSINGIDAPIQRLCGKLNSMQEYFTTSSCSGRIVLIKDEIKKKPGLFLFRSHDKINLKDLKRVLEEVSLNFKKGIVLFKQEPCLVVVSCFDSSSQWSLFNIARNNGWKKSGILSIDKKRLAELMSCENISFPIIKDGKVLVDDRFLNIVVSRANLNLEKGWIKIKKLEGLLKNEK